MSVPLQAPLNPTQQVALRHFDAFYPVLAAALDEEDAERVAELVDARQQAVVELVEAFAHADLPSEVHEHIEGSEAMIHGRLMRFYDTIVLRMNEERLRSFALERYQEAAR